MLGRNLVLVVLIIALLAEIHLLCLTEDLRYFVIALLAYDLFELFLVFFVKAELNHVHGEHLVLLIKSEPMPI